VRRHCPITQSVKCFLYKYLRVSLQTTIAKGEFKQVSLKITIERLDRVKIAIHVENSSDECVIEQVAITVAVSSRQDKC